MNKKQERFYIFGTGAVGGQLKRLFEKRGAENTSAAVKAALGQGVKFDSSEDWAVEIVCSEDDLDAATRYDDAVLGFIAAPTE